MPLLSDQDRATVQKHLEGLTHEVTLLFFTQTIGAPETVHIARQVVNELAELSAQITVEEVNLVLDRERAAQFGVDGCAGDRAAEGWGRYPHAVSRRPRRLRVHVARGGRDARRHGRLGPAGFEQGACWGAVSAPLDIKVFVTPTCVYCPRAVTTAHRMAVESPFVTATCIEATEFPELSRRYRVTGVPKTVADENEILGALPEEDFVAGLLKAQSGGNPGRAC